MPPSRSRRKLLRWGSASRLCVSPADLPSPALPLALSVSFLTSGVCPLRFAAKIPKGFKKGAGKALNAAQVLPSNFGKSGAEDSIKTNTHMGKAVAYFLLRERSQQKSVGSLDMSRGITMGRIPKSAVAEAFERMAFEYNIATEGPAPAMDMTDSLPTTISRPRVDAVSLPYSPLTPCPARARPCPGRGVGLGPRPPASLAPPG